MIQTFPFRELPETAQADILDAYTRKWKRPFERMQRAFFFVNPEMVWADLTEQFSIAFDEERKKIIDLTSD